MEFTSLEQLPDSTELSKKKKGLHKEIYEKRAKGERKWAKDVKYKPLPDLVGQSPAVSPQAKAIYWYLWTLLPCHCPARELHEKTGMTKDQAARGLKELIARNLLFYKIAPKGSTKVIYGVTMDLEKIDLASLVDAIIGEKQKRERSIKNPEIFVRDVQDKKKFVTGTSRTKKEICVLDVQDEKGICVPDVQDEKAHYYDSNSVKDQSPFTDITNKKIQEAPAPVGGPGHEEGRQGELGLMTLIGGGNDYVRPVIRPGQGMRGAKFNIG
jgi:DNA-binding MarR family transcriptional regulator